MKYAVNTATQAKFDQLVNAYSIPYYNMWEMTKEKTCILLSDGFTFADIDYCESNGYAMKTVDEAIELINK